MKIAIINYSSSGLWHYAACLANTLSQQPDVDVLLLTTRQNNLALISKNTNLKLFSQNAPHSLPGFFRWLATPSEQINFYRSLTNFQPDIVHLTDSHALVVPHAWWLQRHPIVFTQHDAVSHTGDVFRLSSRIIQAVQRHLAKIIVVHGQFMKDTLIKQRRVRPAKITIIPHGDYSFFKAWQKPTYQKIPNSILFFGRVIDYKGLDVLLKALIILQHQGLAPTLVLAGAGNLKKYQPLLGQIKNKMITNQTIPDQDVIHFFKSCTVLALPYREASQSGIIAIAMPAEIPIVATHVGALPEILINEQNALLVPPCAPDALARSLRRILENQSLRARLITGGKQTVANRLDWALVAQKYLGVYRALI